MIAKKFAPKGFTLIETLVAVMILASAIAGPLSIASRALNNSLVAKDQIVAFYLAQDAVEYVRFVRDTNTLSGADWITGQGGTTAGTDLTPCITSVNANGCYLDSTMAVVGQGDVPTACDAGSGCPVLYYDNDNSRYTYNSGGSNVVPSLFTRQITMQQINPAPPGSPSVEYLVTVTVSWQDLGSTPRRVTVNENIFKWQ
jgi:prepilin-type N-terminal cleavage/methylation domain-containing protein